MFILKDPNGEVACSIKTGEAFIYFSREIADRAAKALSKERKTEYRAVRA